MIDLIDSVILCVGVIAQIIRFRPGNVGIVIGKTRGKIIKITVDMNKIID